MQSRSSVLGGHRAIDRSQPGGEGLALGEGSKVLRGVFESKGARGDGANFPRAQRAVGRGGGGDSLPPGQGFPLSMGSHVPWTPLSPRQGDTFTQRRHESLHAPRLSACYLNTGPLWALGTQKLPGGPVSEAWRPGSRVGLSQQDREGWTSGGGPHSGNKDPARSWRVRGPGWSPVSPPVSDPARHVTSPRCHLVGLGVG